MSASRGFTLIEVVLAVALFGVCLVLVGHTFLGTIRYTEGVEHATRLERLGEALIDRVARDFEGIPLHLYTNNRQSLPGESARADDVTFEATGSEGAPSEVSFLSGSDSQPDEENRISDITEVGYRTRQMDGGDGLLLDRREEFFTDTDFEAPTVSIPLLRKILPKTSTTPKKPSAKLPCWPPIQLPMITPSKMAMKTGHGLLCFFLGIGKSPKLGVRADQ